MIALGALLAIREAGLRCPEDVSLMGFDDLDLAETTNPSLSSVSQSGYQLGTASATEAPRTSNLSETPPFGRGTTRGAGIRLFCPYRASYKNAGNVCVAS